MWPTLQLLGHPFVFEQLCSFSHLRLIQTYWNPMPYYVTGLANEWMQMDILVFNGNQADYRVTDFHKSIKKNIFGLMLSYSPQRSHNLQSSSNTYAFVSEHLPPALPSLAISGSPAPCRADARHPSTARASEGTCSRWLLRSTAGCRVSTGSPGPVPSMEWLGCSKAAMSFNAYVLYTFIKYVRLQYLTVVFMRLKGGSTKADPKNEESNKGGENVVERWKQWVQSQTSLQPEPTNGKWLSGSTARS